LLTVHAENFLNEVVVHRAGAPGTKNIVGVQSTFIEGSTPLDDVAVTDLQAGMGHRIHLGVAVVSHHMNIEQGALGALLKADTAADLGEGSHLLGLASLEQLLNTGKTLGDVAAGHAA